MSIQTADQWYLQGNQQSFTKGVYYNVPVRSLRVAPGYRVRWYQNADQTGWKTRWFYEGSYPEVYHYGGDHAGRLVVEETDVLKEHCAEISWVHDFGSGTITLSHLIPPGRYYAADPDHGFPNDALDSISLWVGGSAKVFRDGNFSGGNLEFSGGQHIDLHTLGFGDTVSSIEVTADEWEYAGASIESAKALETYEEKSSPTIVYNRTDEENSIEKLISYSTENRQDETLGVNVNTGVNLEVTGGTGDASPVKFETKVGVSVEVGMNTEKSKGTSTSWLFEEKAIVSVPAWSSRAVSVTVKRGRFEFVVVKSMINKKTGYQLQKRTIVTVDNALSAEIVMDTAKKTE